MKTLSIFILLVIAAVLLCLTAVTSLVHAHDVLDISDWEGLTLEQALARTEHSNRVYAEEFAKLRRDFHSTHDNFVRSEHYEQIRRIQASKMSCSECQLIVGVLEGTVKSPALINSTIDFIDLEVCDTLKNATAKDVALCKDLASLAFKTILPLLFKGAASLAWNIPLIMCADFVKVCSTPCCQNAPAVPQQLFLSFANSSNWYNSLAVTWVTQVQTPGAQVRYGALTGSTSGGVQSTAEVFPTRTYTEGGWIGVIHYAQMTNLLPATAYWYQVGNDADGWSNNYTFNTMSENVGHANVQPLKMIAISDMGWDSNSNDTIASMVHVAKTENISAILFTGDISYADGQQPAWDFFMNKCEPLFAQVPVMFSPGNHELEWNFAAYRARLAASQPLPGFNVTGAPGENMFFHQRIGTANFINMNSETVHDTPNIDADQIAWATAVVDANPKTPRTPWRVAGFHRPLYCTDDPKLQCGIFADILKLQIEGFLNDKSVDVVINGHIHTHSASWPVATGGVVTQKNYKDPAAPVYFIVGNPGNREGNSVPKPAPWFNEGYKTIGFTILEFSSIGDQHSLSVTGIDSSSLQQLDQIVIQKTL